MAPVNPPMQSRNDPTYGTTSRPVDVPDTIKPRGVENNTILPEGQKIGDRSAEFEGQATAFGSAAQGAAAQGFADLFSGIAKTGDFLGQAGVNLVKRDIENRVYDAANAEREAYTQALEHIKATGGTKGILGPDASTTEAPSEVQDLSERLGTLVGAKDAGKITSTYYEGRLLAEAKQLRSKYPGFREEIDSQFAKVTGTNPANAYVRALTMELNSQATQKGSRLNSTLHYIRENSGIPGAVQLYDDIVTGRKDPVQGEREAIRLFAPHEMDKVQMQERKAKIEDVNLTRGEKSFQAEKLYDQASSTIINREVDTVLQRLGLTDDQSAVRIGEGLQSGAIDPKTWEAEGQALLDKKTRLRAEMIRAADEHGITANLKGGKEELIKRVDASLSQFDDIAARIYKPDTGTLTSLRRDMAAQKDQDKRDILGDSVAGPILRQSQVFRDLQGENYMRDLNMDLLKQNWPAQYKDFFTRWSNEIATQSNYGPSGKPSTFKNMFDEIKRKGINVPEASATVLKQMDKLTDSKTPDAVKENLAIAAFSPEARGFISMLNPDGFDQKGRPIKGQSAVFQNITTPEKTKELHRLGEKNPKIWEDYVNTAEYIFGKEILPRELADLKSLGEDNRLKIIWDTDNKRLDVKYIHPTPEGHPEAGEYYPPLSKARRTLNQINNNMYGFKNIAEAANKDVDVFLLRTIKDTVGDIKGIKDIPQQILDQIELGRNFEGRFGVSQRKK